MLYLYDDAILNHLKDITNNSIPIILTPVDKFYERYELVQGEDKIRIPALSLWRTKSDFYPTSAVHDMRVANMAVPLDEDTDREVFSIKVDLHYNLEIWASTDRMKDDMLKDVLMILTRYPSFYLLDKDRDSQIKTGIRHKFDIRWESPTDNTEISNLETVGNVYRYTVPLTIEGCRFLYYEDVPIAKGIDFSIYMDNETTEELIIHDQPESFDQTTDTKLDEDSKGNEVVEQKQDSTAPYYPQLDGTPIKIPVDVDPDM